MNAADRDVLLKYLNDNGIDAKTHYSIPIHKQEGFPWGKSTRIVGSLAMPRRMPPPASLCPCSPS